MSGLSNAFLARIKGLATASSSRYKATLHYGANRPTVATATYAASGLGELATVGTLYTTGVSGVAITSTSTANGITFTDKDLVTGAGETLGPADTIAIWDTNNANELVGLVDVAPGQQTASNGGTFRLDFQAATINFSVA